MNSAGNATRERVLSAIEAYHREHGIAPSIRDICEATGIFSTSTIASHLNTLKEQGRITWRPSIPRSVRIIVKGNTDVI